jgi:hypothetical protein
MSFRHPFATAQPEETRAITVKDIRADAPKFARSYTVKLDDRATLRVTIKSFLGRYSSGELTQPNGRWVFFDPDRIADKILDPVLLPLVERYCKIIRDMASRRAMRYALALILLFLAPSAWGEP